MLLASLLPLAFGIYLCASPVQNPGVQDCGAPVVFAVTGRTNGRLPPDGVVMPPDELARLRAQTPCNELVEQRMRWATWSFAGFLMLAFGGAILGLVDDRLSLRRAPRFESLLRERTSDLPGEVWDRPVVPESDIGVTLPDVEGSDVEALVVWSVVTVVGLAFVAGVGATLDPLGSVNVLGLLVVLVLAAGARLVAGAQLAVIDSGARAWPDRLRRALPVMVAADWAGRIRPAFGAIGIEEHALVRSGTARHRASLAVGVSCLVALVVHFVFAGVLFVAWVLAGERGGGWPRFPLVLVLVLLALVVAGLLVAVPRFRQLPCTLDRSTLDALRVRVQDAPTQVLILAGLSLALLVLHGLVVLVLLASLGSTVPAVAALFWVTMALVLRAWAPVPEGLVAADLLLVIGLCTAGVAPAIAVVAVLLWRVAMVWLPMVPGVIVTRRLVPRGVL